MKNNISLSVVVEIKNENHVRALCEKLSSIQNALEEVEFILIAAKEQYVSDKLKEEISKCCRNFKVANAELIVEAYNIAKEMCAGETVIFTDESVVLSSEVLHKILKLQCKEETNIYGINLTWQNSNVEIMSGQYNLDEHIWADALNLGRYLFRKNILGKYSFEESHGTYFKDGFLMKVLSEEKSICFKGDLIAELRIPSEINAVLYEEQFNEEWYGDYFEKIAIPLLEKNSERVSFGLQNIVFRALQLRYRCNKDQRDKQVLIDTAVDEFFDITKRVLHHIDDEVIVNLEDRTLLPRAMTLLFMQVKHNDFNLSVQFAKNKDDCICGFLNGKELVDADDFKIDMKAINFDDDYIVMEGTLWGTSLYCNNVELKCMLNGKDIGVIEAETYSLTKYFGRTMQRELSFTVHIPMQLLDKNNSVKFKIKTGEYWTDLRIHFAKVQSRLNESRRFSYFNINGKYTLKYNRAKKTIAIHQYRKKDHLINELKLLASYLISKNDKKQAIKAVGVRLLYWLTPRDNCWIFFDKLYKAGDNAEYLFKYCCAQKDGINPYYVINKTSSDYERLVQQHSQNVVEFKSIKNILKVLKSQAIFATHSNVFEFCGIDKYLKSYVRDLLSAEVFCIQHGLTMQQIAQYQNKLFDNTKLYFCASKYEIDNLSKGIYGYSPEQLKLTGLARYDGLINNDKKQILITPTWRRNIAIAGNQIGDSREYNENFKYTEYFRIYNNLINDKKLIETAKKTGYKIVYLLHPVTSCQACDFYSEFDNVEILASIGDSSYEKILTESSLMVTDYSGVQYDFAYMKKPLLYYHPETLPAQYGDGGMDYDNMGFGTICKTQETLVEELCEYMENQCVMKPQYKNRAEEFFAYGDFANCERIYDEALKYLTR